MTRGDNRWTSMCSDPLASRSDDFLGADECISPFGIYELEIPINKGLACGGSRITTFNCKDLDVSATLRSTTKQGQMRLTSFKKRNSNYTPKKKLSSGSQKSV